MRPFNLLDFKLFMLTLSKSSVELPKRDSSFLLIEAFSLLFSSHVFNLNQEVLAIRAFPLVLLEVVALMIKTLLPFLLNLLLPLLLQQIPL